MNVQNRPATAVDDRRAGLVRSRPVPHNGGVPGREHPILSGLTALVAVSVGIGLIFGLGALVASWGLGLGESDTAIDTPGTRQSMYLPKPEPTEDTVGPLVSLGPAPTAAASSGKPKSPIQLQAAQTQVAPMQQIDLSGSYPGKDGAVLQVQRFQGGAWQDFAQVDVIVQGGQFSTYIQTGQIGKTRFRMLDTTSQETSNEIVVTIG